MKRSLYAKYHLKQINISDKPMEFIAWAKVYYKLPMSYWEAKYIYDTIPIDFNREGHYRYNNLGVFGSSKRYVKSVITACHITEKLSGVPIPFDCNKFYKQCFGENYETHAC